MEFLLLMNQSFQCYGRQKILSVLTSADTVFHTSLRYFITQMLNMLVAAVLVTSAIGEVIVVHSSRLFYFQRRMCTWVRIGTKSFVFDKASTQNIFNADFFVQLVLWLWDETCVIRYWVWVLYRMWDGTFWNIFVLKDGFVLFILILSSLQWQINT